MIRPEPKFGELGDMEDLLKSSVVSSLGEEGMSVPVEVPTKGEILFWVKKTGEEVYEGEVLCFFVADAGERMFIHAPYLRILSLLSPDEAEAGPLLIGALIITVKEGEVFGDVPIAIISRIIKPTIPTKQFIKPTIPTKQ